MFAWWPLVYMKENNKNNLLTILFVALSGTLVYSMIQQVLRGYDKGSWQITEWLINYQGGFVRRGLPGELILWANEHLNINPYYFILAICAFFFFLLLTIFVILFRKKGLPIFLIPFVFLLGNPIINDFWVRKDIFGVLLFSLAVFLTTIKSSWRYLLINIVLIFGILAHESIGFFSLPIIVLLTYSNIKSCHPGKRKAVFISFLSIAPAIIAFFSGLYFKGSALIAQKIWDSWQGIRFPFDAGYTVPVTAIDGLSWSLGKGLGYTKSLLSNFSGGIYAPVAWLLIILAVYLIITNFDRFKMRGIGSEEKSLLLKDDFSAILLFQLLCVSPLFILGWDYGRWVFIWVASSFASVLILPGQVISNLRLGGFRKFSLFLNSFFQKIITRRPRLVVMTAIFIGLPSYSWILVDFLKTNSIVLIFRNILPVKEWFYFLLNLVR